VKRPPIRQTHIRAAQAHDTRPIYDLLIEAFGGRYLSYTIFQSSQSAAYLQCLIEQGLEQSGHLFYVADLAQIVKGFYDAVLHRGDFVLNYIAVSRPERSAGIGNVLLSHFEARGAMLGCQQYVLDVFESNQLAYRWYLNHGYRADSANFQARLLTARGVTRASWPLVVAAGNLQLAVREERAKGFSKVDGTCGNGQITIGLIGGHVCKLLAYHDIDLEEAVEAVCARFQSDRPVLIVPALPVVPTAWPILDFEKTLRLVKPAS
jgi:ribosomal protein S18 acetylase RimI-like enzyme